MDEVVYFDVIPASGEHVEGVAVEKLPNPPLGRWVLWGKAVGREAN